jgi:acyl-CoA dehydrogenase
MDYSMSEPLLALQRRVRTFIREEVIPLDSDCRQRPHGADEDLRRGLSERARAAGMMSPDVSPHYGCMGFSHHARAVVFEKTAHAFA